MADTNGQSLLSIRNLKTYFPTDEGLVRAVDGVSFDVNEGKTLGIVGESGCGKSTVGRSILQILDKPGIVEDGEIKWSMADGRNIDIAQEKPNGSQMRQIRGAEIALIFQEPMTSFSPVHTIGNQLMEAIKLHNDLPKKAVTSRAIELLDMVAIPNPQQRLHEYSYQLSGGLRQRAMIAMALSCNPRLLIADEPTTALDVTTQAQILDLLMSLQDEQKMAVMLITHNLGVIAEMADDVVVMYLGRAVETGNIRDVFNSPQHPYTQGLLRSIPSAHGGSGGRLPAIGGTVPHPFNRPSGCTFRTRCPQYMQGVCNTNDPVLQSLEGGTQVVSCFLHHPPEEVSASG